MLKSIVASWYGEIGLKNLKEKPIKSIRIKAPLSVPTMYPWSTIFFGNKKKIHFETTFENNLQF